MGRDALSHALKELDSEASREWSDRYRGYLTDIFENSQKWHRNFRRPAGVSLYTTVAKRNEQSYAIRFKGQNIGTIKVEAKGNKSLEIANSKLTQSMQLMNGSFEWESDKASDIRKKLSEFELQSNTLVNEHMFENALLQEFRTRSSCNKQILNIQPILLHGCFFQMPTPLSASGNEIRYAGPNGGGIDILARFRTVDNHIRLCVFELKDENKATEPQSKAMKQGVAYATFVARLVTEQPDWWEFLMGHHELRGRCPGALEKDVIEVVTIMPKAKCQDSVIDNQEIVVDGTNISLHCRTLYFDKEHYLENGKFRFSGSFLDDIKK